MAKVQNPIVVIPVRLAATRLPNKPLADIQGEPMVVHVWYRAMEAAIGPAIVAVADEAIGAAVEAAGGRWVLTRADHASGSDRIFEAVSTLDPDGAHDVVVNLQGDLPLIRPEAIRTVLQPLENSEVDIATLAAPLADAEEMADSHVVKVAMAPGENAGMGRALSFARNPAPDAGPFYHHIGLYAYRREALQRFVGLPQSAWELAERLEQLRALDAGMRIDVALVDTVPLGVDTPADLARVREWMGSGKGG
ncbi:MAG: 3-deoxy-manno-octulosonate cytidylyltransferase [Alphaproteobacteria bacterium]|nr:3-deoxy-manno-octulosonate cytidylyltransferase [Alphaproteobacteria bacterium]